MQTAWSSCSSTREAKRTLKRETLAYGSLNTCCRLHWSSVYTCCLGQRPETYQARTVGSSGEGCSNAAVCSEAVSSARLAAEGPGIWWLWWQRGWVVGWSGCILCLMGCLWPWIGCGGCCQGAEARRQLPAAAAARVSGTSHAGDGVTSRVRATRHGLRTTWLTACPRLTAGWRGRRVSGDAGLPARIGGWLVFSGFGGFA